MPNTAGESNNSKPASPQGFGTVSLSNDESEEHMEESVNSEDSSEYQPSLQRTFVNNAMMRDNDDHLIEEDDNMYGANNMDHHQSFNMSGGNQGNFNLHKSTSGNGAPGSSTGSSSTSNPAAAHLSKAAKKRRRFTPEEDKKIKEGIAKHKKDNNIDWDGVAKYACLERTKEQIKSRFMRMRKDEGEPAAQQGVASSSGVSSSNNNNNSNNNNGGASSSKDNNNNIINGQNSADKYSNTATNTNNNNNNQLTIPSSVSSSITESSTYQSNQPQSLPPQTSPVIYLAPPNSNNTSSTLNCNKQENSLSIEGEELTEPSNKKQKTLPQMFQSLQAGSSKKSQSNMASSSNQNSNSLYIDASNNSNSFMMSYNSNSSMGSSAINNTGVQSNIEAYQQQIAKLQLELEQVKEQLKQKDKSLENSESKTKGYESEISQMKNAIHDFDIKNTERNKRFREIAVQFLRERAERERIEDKKRVNEKSITIGTITYQKGLDVYEVWQDGTLFQQLKENENRITTEKDKLEKQKKNIQKQRQQLKKEQNITNGDMEFLRKIEEQLHDLNEQEETVKLKLIHLKKDETQNIAEQENLLIEKSIQIREIKRIRDQEKSMFKNYPIIGHQKYIPTTPDGPGTPQINGQQPQPSNHHEYFLMKMLGKGGFSEVYKAYDLTDFKVVACKIHQLNPNWKEHRKENYIKHVLRECQINQSINHEKLIKMYDTFVFDNNTFVTVLEYCEGADLDLYIKKHQRVPEREAKNIIAQIFSGLNYLCQQKQRVIHYDLKPANILFDKDGNIKITDFGLSKIMDEEESIELTSQGAGTYWYLPPECFYNPSGEGPPPKISNKVDVWSAGVIFFQMLYGTKPFGNNLSQQKILSEGTIVNATQVGFPDKPTVSEEAKEFIRRCLTHEMSKRPDVKTLYNDSYLRGTSAPSSSSGTTSKSKKREKEAPQPSSTPTSSTNFLSFQQ